VRGLLTHRSLVFNATLESIPNTINEAVSGILVWVASFSGIQSCRDWNTRSLFSIL